MTVVMANMMMHLIYAYILDLSGCTEISKYNCPQHHEEGSVIIPSYEEVGRSVTQIKNWFNLTQRTSQSQHSFNSRDSPFTVYFKKWTVQSQMVTLEINL